MIIGGDMLKMEVFYYNQILYGKILHKSNELMTITECPNNVFVYDAFSTNVCHDLDRNRLTLNIGDSGSTFSKMFRPHTYTMLAIEDIKKAVEFINNGECGRDEDIASTNKITLIGNDMLMVELIEYENMLFGSIIKQDDNIGEGMIFDNGHFKIRRVSVPQLTHESLYIQGVNKERNNEPLYYVGGSLSSEEVKDKLIGAITGLHEREGVEFEVYTTED